ncbi:MAG: efflux RND transporter periplasmic adaptor subunit [Gammaproteobacteria bacterium]|nr:MAG: efflux RND transporter periplasmic adaptor subunit [Gammaproteobacteria bacterium]
MTKNTLTSKKVGFILLIIASCQFLLSACSDKSTAVVINKPSQYSLETIKVKPQILPVYYQAVGTIISDKRVDISSRMTGFIQAILVKEGQKVNKGQILVKLDNSIIDGNIKQGRAARNKAQSSLRDAITDLKRYQQLFNTGSVSDNALRKIRLKKEIAESALHEVKANLTKALSEQQYSRIVSPVEGIVVTRQKRVGDLAAPGSTIVTLESESDLLLESYVAESQINKVKVGQQVNVLIDALKLTVQAKVIRVIHAGNQFSRRFQIKLALPKTEGMLSGMFAYALFPVASEEAIVIPSEAVFNRGGLEGVFVRDQQKNIHFRWLHLSRKIGENIQVNAGLTVGETIVAVANSQLKEGDIVNTVEIQP